jgi:hypothetical protein
MPTTLVTGTTEKQGGAIINAILFSNRSDLKILHSHANPNLRPRNTLEIFKPLPLQATFQIVTPLMDALKDVDAAYLVMISAAIMALTGKLTKRNYLFIAPKEMASGTQSA